MNHPAPSDSYLLIDAGNSVIKWAFTRPGLTPETLHTTLRNPMQRDDIFLATGTLTNTVRTSPLFIPIPDWDSLPTPHSVWISNVAGQAIAQRLTQWLHAQWPTVAQHTIRAQRFQCGVTNNYDLPEQLGSDRWASLIGAHTAYPHEALFIATLGTATTLETLDAHGHFIGGLIAPGPAIMLRALSQNTAQLPKPENLSSPHCTNLEATAPSPFFALDTSAALQQGARLMQVGFIERGWHSALTYLRTAASASDSTLSHAKEALSPRCLLSGGAALEIAPWLSLPYTYHPHLVLQGLAVMAFEATQTHPQAL